MPNPYYVHNLMLIVYRVDDTIVSYTQAPLVPEAVEFLATRWPRIGR
jgi:hypothetical protein